MREHAATNARFWHEREVFERRMSRGGGGGLFFKEPSVKKRSHHTTKWRRKNKHARWRRALLVGEHLVLELFCSLFSFVPRERRDATRYRECVKKSKESFFHSYRVFLS